jgi:hypothetical protein
VDLHECTLPRLQLYPRLHFFRGETVLFESGSFPVLHERSFLALLVKHVALR